MSLFLPFIFFLSLVFLCILSFSPFFCFFLPFLLSVPFTFTATPFYTICHCGIYHFFPQLLLAPYGYPSRTSHCPAGYPATASAQSVLVAPLSIPRQNYLSCFLPLLVFTLPIYLRIKLPNDLPLWHALSGSSPYLPLLGEMSSQ